MHVTLQAQAMHRWRGITKARKKCSITSCSKRVDDTGRHIAGPLCRDGDVCALHAKAFCTKPSQVDNFENIVLFVLDLETTGVDISKDIICEIAAT